MVVAFLIFGGLLLLLYVRAHQVIIFGNQRSMAEDAAQTVSGFIRGKTDLMSDMLRLDAPLKLPPKARRVYLESLLGIEPSFRSLSLINSAGQIKECASRLTAQASRRFCDSLELDPVFSSGRPTGTYTSSVYIDPLTSEPLVILAVPSVDIFRDFDGYLVAELNLKFMWEMVDQLKAGKEGDAYVVDRRGNLIASSDTARVLRVENVGHVTPVRNFMAAKSAEAVSDAAVYQGITGERVVGAFSSLGTPDWAVVVEVAWGEAYRPVLGNLLLSLAVFLVFSLLAGGLGILIARRLASPLVRLTETAGLIAAGAGGVPVEVRGPREVAGLASAFNSMTSQLLESRASLETQLVEIKNGQEALRESEERFRNIFTNANEIIYTLSPDGVFTFVSPAWTRFLGHPVEEVEGSHFAPFVHPDDVPACKAFLDKVMSTGLPQEGVTYRVKHRDGTWRWHTSVGSAVAGAGGRPAYYVGIAQDITWKKRAEEEKANLEEKLFQAQKMESIGRLAGGVAHDFNNMLNVILGYAELIRLETPSRDKLLQHIEEIERAAGQARDVTRQLLAFSRKQVISPVPLDVNDVIGENRETLARLIGEDVDLRFFPGAGLWRVRLDPSQLNQIVYNLAINAHDAMPDGGRLTIETANASLDETYCRDHPGFNPGDYVRLTVSDDGVGMDRETMSHLFEPFFTTKEVGKGTGLGMATVYGIVKQNGGFLNVYSEPGKGTSLHIYFRKDTDAPPPPAKPVETETPAGEGLVMVVEDDDLVRSITTVELEKLGYRVVSLKSPEEALSLCGRDGPAFKLLITDVIMPGMNGIELKNRMSALRPGTKVLFMSGYTADAIGHHGVLEKKLHFLQKPFSLNELAKKVREAIDD